MNKQELIAELKKGQQNIKRGISDGYNAFYNGIDTIYSIAIGLAKKLDEPKKVVIPKFVAKKIESYGSALEMLANEYFDQSSEEVDSDELACWIDGNADLFFNAWVCGYEVEKEQLYYVSFGFDRFLIKGDCKTTTGEDFIWIEVWECIENEGFEELVKFTEQEIKAIDERYWPFAVKVGEE